MVKKVYSINPCGLCCDLCDAKTTRVQDAARIVSNYLRDPNNQSILTMANPDVKEEKIVSTQETLEKMSTFPPCPGCEKRDECSIKTCAKQKNLNNCSECTLIDLKNNACTAPPTPPAMPFLPPTPVFFKGLSQRYRNWNIENLRLLKAGKREEVNLRINQLRAGKKSLGDLIDISQNLFQMKSPPGE